MCFARLTETTWKQTVVRFKLLFQQNITPWGLTLITKDIAKWQEKTASTKVRYINNTVNDNHHA